MRGFIIRVGDGRYWRYDRSRQLNDTAVPGEATRFADPAAAKRQAFLIRVQLVALLRHQQAELVAVLPADDA